METEKHLQQIRQTIELELNFSGSGDHYADWLSELSIIINDLIVNDFNRLLSLLYRLDVDELRVTTLLKERPDSDAGKIIGELIIERQLQKMKTREFFKRNDTGIDENERW